MSPRRGACLPSNDGGSTGRMAAARLAAMTAAALWPLLYGEGALLLLLSLPMGSDSARGTAPVSSMLKACLPPARCAIGLPKCGAVWSRSSGASYSNRNLGSPGEVWPFAGASCGTRAGGVGARGSSPALSAAASTRIQCRRCSGSTAPGDGAASLSTHSTTTLSPRRALVASRIFSRPLKRGCASSSCMRPAAAFPAAFLPPEASLDGSPLTWTCWWTCSL
mmetsp:Transcript_11946/g.35226  ORF Transcript_11946/g.35226 Transcript_11946/m.35226 type:complete len:222 (+) Transcript_11946:2202-2867(+)